MRVCFSVVLRGRYGVLEWLRSQRKGKKRKRAMELVFVGRYDIAIAKWIWRDALMDAWCGRENSDEIYNHIILY